MKVIFLLPAGVIDWPIPEEVQKEFQFNIFCGNIRINGYFQTTNLYLRHEQMVGMLFESEIAPAPKVVRKDLQ